jgi:4a-hydroxytetrahydrobiopterin dehydratase
LPPLGRDDLRDALGQLKEWIGDNREIRRTMRLDESEHAALAERIKVVSDALQVQALVRRLDGYTQVCLRTSDGEALTAGEVNLAARIEDAYRSVTSHG